MKQLVVFFLSLVIYFTSMGQGDYPRYSKVAGHGFVYKRVAIDSVALMPLATSPHTPYRAGGYRYNQTDSTVELWTGYQWLKINAGIENTTASNGLTKELNDIKLGGSLTENTTINGKGLYRLDQDSLVGLDIKTIFPNTTIGPDVYQRNSINSEEGTQNLILASTLNDITPDTLIYRGQMDVAYDGISFIVDDKSNANNFNTLNLTTSYAAFRKKVLIGSNTSSSTALAQVNSTSTSFSTPYLALGPFLSNSIYSTLHTSDTVTAANETSIPVRGYQMNRNLVIGANGNINLTGKNGAADSDILRVRDTLTLNASGHNNWYANLSGLSFLKAGGYSGRSSIRGGVDGISDAPTAFTAELVIAGSTGSNNYHFYGDWTSLTAELAHTASAQDTMDHYMSVWANANYAGRILKAEYFRGYNLAVSTDSLWSVYFEEAAARGYHQGNFGIGVRVPLYKLHVDGTAAITTLPTETSTTGMHILLSDNSTNQIKKIDPANLPTGSPGLTSTQIAFGNQSGVQTSSAYLRFIDSTKAVSSKKFLAGNYVSSGDSTYRFSPFIRSYFFGNSITAGSAITPQYVRWPTRVANGLNHIEYNYAIGQTRLVTLAAGDSAMEERTFLIPTYDAARDGYLFFAYGTNDAVTLSIDTAAFRTAYNSIISNATGKGWPLSRIVLVSNGYYLHSIGTLQTRGLYFRNVTESVALTAGTRFVDTRTAQLNAGGLSTLKLPSDSVHLNEMGNQAWALAVLDTLGAKSGDGRFNGYLSARALHLRAWKNGGIGNAFAANSLPVLLSATDSTEQPIFEIRAAIGSSTNNESMGVGLNALQNMTTGNSNMGIGPLSFQALTTGSNNTAVGPAAGYNTTTGNNITAIGKNALFSNTTNSELTAVGRDALYSNGSGASNTGVGYSALRLNVTGNNQTAVGYAALENATSGGNGAFGSVALRNNVSGTNNNAFGSSSLSTNVSGSSNTAMGNRALRATTVDFNTAIGANAGDSVTTGASNTLLGYRAGYNLKTGSNNVVIGPASGLGLVSGSDNIYIGRWTNASSTASGTIAFSPGSNDPRFVSLGDGKTGLGTASPLQRLHVAGKVAIDTVSNGTAGDSVLTIKNREVQKISIPVIASGRYAPTLTIIGNVDATTQVDDFHYQRIGNTVTIDGMLNIDPTANTTTTNVDIDLFFASTMTNFTNLTGFVLNGEGVGGQIVAVGNKGRVGFTSQSTSSQVYTIHIAYEITP